MIDDEAVLVLSVGRQDVGLQLGAPNHYIRREVHRTARHDVLVQCGRDVVLPFEQSKLRRSSNLDAGVRHYFRN